MESAELKNQRLKEVFQTKIQEFRKVCYTLTGYQVDITTENQYRLTSMYAEQKADCLIFKVGRGAPRALPSSLSVHPPRPAPGAQDPASQCSLGAEEQGEGQGGALSAAAGAAGRRWAGPVREP